MQLIVIVVFSFLAGFFDCFWAMPIPTGAILSGAFFWIEKIKIATLISAFFLSLGSTLSLYILRSLIKKINIRNSIWINRITVLTNFYGYFIVYIFCSFTLIMWVTYTYLLVTSVNYKKYFLALFLGRLTVLCFYVFGIRVVDYPLIIAVLIVVYIAMIFSFIKLLRTNKNLRLAIIKADQSYANLNSYNLQKSKFHQFILKQS